MFLLSNNFNHDQLFLKTKFQDLKRQSSGEISEKSQNDVFQCRHTLKTGHDMNKKIF